MRRPSVIHSAIRRFASLNRRLGMRGIRNRGVLVLAIACVLVPVGCSVPGPDRPEGTFGLDFSMPEDAKIRGAVVFLVDGVNAAMFEQMLEAGELPAIKKYFVDRGVYAPARSPTRLRSRWRV